jgi:hypothetical protein
MQLIFEAAGGSCDLFMIYGEVVICKAAHVWLISIVKLSYSISRVTAQYNYML